MDAGQGAYLRHLKAQEVAPGDRFLTRRGDPAPPVTAVRTTRDDFGTPALVIATLQGGREVTIAHGSVIRVRTDRPGGEDGGPAFSPVDEGTDEALVVALARRHPEDRELMTVGARLSSGVNLRSGAHLEDLLAMARRLYLELEDEDGALAALEMLTGLPWDGAMGRWKSIRSAVSLAAHILRTRGQTQTADSLAARVHDADEPDQDPVRAKRDAELLQRQLDEPELYDRELSRALQAHDVPGEHRYRGLRLENLLWLRAHGGSATLSETDLDGRIGREVSALRRLRPDEDA